MVPYSFLGSLRGCSGPAQLALTSSRFEWADVEFLMVRCNACPVVLHPLPNLVVYPTLHSPFAVYLLFFFFLMYCLCTNTPISSHAKIVYIFVHVICILAYN